MRRFLWLALFVAGTLSAVEPTTITLVNVQRIYVESLGASPQAILLRDMVISSLAASGMFSVTENAEHADALLRGSADDAIFNETHDTSDSLNAGLHNGSSQSYSSRYDHTGSSKTGGINIGENDTSHSTERKHEASASVRLINRNGDVIWSTTQESNGARFRSASADVADKIYRKLCDDLQRSRSGVSAISAASAAMHAGIPAR